MTYLDGFGSLPQLVVYLPDALQPLKAESVSKLRELVPTVVLAVVIPGCNFCSPPSLTAARTMVKPSEKTASQAQYWNRLNDLHVGVSEPTPRLPRNVTENININLIGVNL